MADPMPEPTADGAGADERREVVTGGHEVFAGRLLRVRVDEVRLPSGRTSTREVVEHRGAVAIVPVTADGQVLLVRQYRHAAGETLLELPAGTREPGEDPAETARRELAEEIGYAAGTLTELVTYLSSAGYSTERITLFRADGCTPIEGAAVDATDEGIELVPVPLAEVPALLAPGDGRVGDAKTLIGLLWLLRGDAADDPPEA